MSSISQTNNYYPNLPADLKLIIEAHLRPTELLYLKRTHHQEYDAPPVQRICHLDLSKNDITDEHLTAILKRYPPLLSINLTGCHRITKVGAGALAHKITNSPQLTSLILDNCPGINHSGLKLIGEALKTCAVLQRISLRGVLLPSKPCTKTLIFISEHIHWETVTHANFSEWRALFPSGARALLEKVNRCQNLTSFHFSGFCLGTQITNLIAQHFPWKTIRVAKFSVGLDDKTPLLHAFSNCPKPTQLTLESPPLFDTESQLLANNIHWETITEIDLSNRYKDRGAPLHIDLTHAICRCQAPLSLNLENRELTAKSLAHLAQHFHWETLETLNLNNCHLSPSTWAILEPGLKRCQNLTSLSLAENTVDEPALHLLNNSLPWNMLKHIDISSWNLPIDLAKSQKLQTIKAAHLLMSSYRLIQSIHWERVTGFDFSHQMITNPFILLEALSNCTRLQWCNLPQLTDFSVIALVSILRQNQNFESLDISDSKGLSQQTIQAVLQAFAHHAAIQSINTAEKLYRRGEILAPKPLLFSPPASSSEP